MNKLISMYIAAELWLEEKKNKLFYKEDGAVDIIAIVVLIAIAVALAIVFRTKIKQLLDDLFKDIGNNQSAATGQYGG